MAPIIRPCTNGKTNTKGAVSVPANNLTGRVIGRWTVLAYAGRSASYVAYWNCQCACGAMRTVAHKHMLSGESTSCGCAIAEKTSRRQKTHGKSRTPEYISWGGMLERCSCAESKSYHNYGGRGITVCDRWQTFEHFLADMGPRPTPKHSLDRKDNNGDYCPDNCRWATKKEQANNRRGNSRWEYRGEVKTLSAWAEYAGIPHSTLRNRLLAGCSIQDAIERPVRKCTRRHR